MSERVWDNIALCLALDAIVAYGARGSKGLLDVAWIKCALLLSVVRPYSRQKIRLELKSN